MFRAFLVNILPSAAVLALILIAPVPTPAAPAAPAPGLWKVYDEFLAHAKYVDLTHTIAPKIPVWKGFGPSKFAPTVNPQTNKPYDYKTDGFAAMHYDLSTDQLGTQLDPPAHWAPEYPAIDELPATYAVRPLVVISIVDQVKKDPGYQMQISDVLAWEKLHGRIPGGSVVFIHSDWSKRWPDAAKMENKDANGIAHYPGWSLPALKYLYEERKITASGHETTDTDPGFAASKNDYSLERYVLGTNHYQIELLTNLDQVPEAGAIAVVSFPKPKGGSGFPARAFAIVP
jgi:kynurenine formamidase